MAEGSEEGNGTCPKCGSSRTFKDHVHAQIVCRDCGRVIEENMKDTGPEWRSFNQKEEENRSRGGPPISPTKHDKGLSTEIARSSRDAKGNLISPERRSELGRIKKWHGRSKFGEGRTRTLKHALSRISAICSQIGLPNNAKERASYLYRAAMEEGIIRGRPSEAVVAAMLRIACGEMNLPVSYEKITEAAGVREKEVNKAHMVVVHELNLDAPRPSPASYISVVMRELNFFELNLSNVGLDAREIMREANRKSLVQGRSRMNVAAAAVLLAINHREVSCSVNHVVGSLDLTHSAVRGAAEALKKGLGEDVLSRIVNNSEGGENHG